MRKTIFMLIGLLVMSCASSKAVREAKSSIKGQWLLSDITYNQSGVYKISLLKDSSPQCFEGSLWQFVPNNNTGMYTISNADCAGGVRHFIFTIEDVNSATGQHVFLLKPTDAKHKSETNEGFRMVLTQLTASNMQLQQTVTVDGQPFTIAMNFSKQ